MPIIYRTCPNDEKAITYLNKLGEDNWIYCGQLNDKLVFRKEEKKKRESKELNLSGFDEFYSKYPRKCSRGNAEKAWNKLSENQRILALEGIKKYIIYWKKKGTQKEFIPHPATWLDINDQRWNDDLSEVPETAIVQTNAKAKEQDEEDRKNQQEKEALDHKIEYYRKQPDKWKEICKKAEEELTEQQKQSPIKDALIRIKVRMLVNNL